jgi:transcriptional repressor NrdR
MVCIYCGAETKVNNSRLQRRNNQVWRRRECLDCQAVVTTIESLDYSSSLLVESSRGYEPFLADRLYTELLLSLEHRKSCFTDARELTLTIIRNLLKQPGSPVFSPKQISNETLSVLKRFDKKAWHKFSAERTSL